jgi:phosphoadenosine phosphosulfate reductase
MDYQMQFGKNAPDDDAIYWIKFYEGMALERDPRGYCVCTSEGKDSRVLGHLFRRAGVKHFYVHNITGIDPPELVYFQRRNFAQYEEQGYVTCEIMYDKSMWEMMRKNLIPPTRKIRYCCAEFKEKRSETINGCLLSIGVRKAESVRRSKTRDEIEIVGKDIIIMPFENGEKRRVFEYCQMDHEVRINPIVNWTTEDIWNYSSSERLEQCTLYFEGFDRLGCIGCPMAGKRDRRKEFERWHKFELLYRRAFRNMYDERVRRGLRVFRASGDEWFERWRDDEEWCGEDVDEDQLTLYEGQVDNDGYDPTYSLLDQLKMEIKQ